MPDDTSTYLIWSAEHQSWWGPDGNGYARRLSRAGRYSHAAAMDICIRAIPGAADRFGLLPELPVQLADVEAMQAAHRAVCYPGLPAESWE